MQKISDFFEVEAFYDDSKGYNAIHFYWDEGDEEYLWNFDRDILEVGDKEAITWRLIKEWYEDNKEEIDNMISSHDIHYVKDIIK